MKTVISLFPELCKPAFVADGAVISQRVIDMLKPHLADKRETMNDDERRVWEFLVDFANHATKEGIYRKVNVLFVSWLYCAHQMSMCIVFLCV